MNKTLSTDLTSENIAVVMEVLTESPKRLEALRKSVAAEKLSQPLGKGERTPVEVLAHILNTEARSSEMIYQALLVNEPFFVNIHPERDWGKLLRLDLLSFDELLAYFNVRRKVLLHVLSELTEAKWARAIQEQGKKRKESVYWRARTIVMHELDHLNDLEKKLGK